MKSLKTYTKDFKIQVCKLILNKNKPVPQLAKAVNVPSHTIYRWIKEYQDYGEDAFVGCGYLRSPEAKLKQLQKTNEKLFRLTRHYNTIGLCRMERCRRKHSKRNIKGFCEVHREIER